ncbi:hypothetical protein ES705_02901 [subsurface metagenome]
MKVINSTEYQTKDLKENLYRKYLINIKGELNEKA